MNERAIVYMAWGEAFVGHAAASMRESVLPDYPVYLITDRTTAVDTLPPGVTVVRHDFRFHGKLAKIELLDALPPEIGIALFLDVDTRVLGDISLGFEKAGIHGLAMAPAPHYSLEHFRNFGTVMDREGVPRRGQLCYNSGVMFFDSRSADVRAIFRLAAEVASRDEATPWGDQTYISLAMEMLGFNPYTLSIAFNHRGFGELVSGPVRIWHSYKAAPAGAATLGPGALYRYEKGTMVTVRAVPSA